MAVVRNMAKGRSWGGPDLVRLKAQSFLHWSQVRNPRSGLLLAWKKVNIHAVNSMGTTWQGIPINGLWELSVIPR